MNKVEFTPKFKELFCKIPKEIQDIAKKILERLEYKMSGMRLGGDLRECYSIHFFGNRYRLIVTQQQGKIIAIYVGKRKDHFYKDVLEALKSLRK